MTAGTVATVPDWMAVLPPGVVVRAEEVAGGLVTGTALGAGTTTMRRVTTWAGGVDDVAFLALAAMPPTINSPALSEMPVTAIRPPLAGCLFLGALPEECR